MEQATGAGRDGSRVSLSRSLPLCRSSLLPGGPGNFSCVFPHHLPPPLPRLVCGWRSGPSSFISSLFAQPGTCFSNVSSGRFPAVRNMKSVSPNSTRHPHRSPLGLPDAALQGGTQSSQNQTRRGPASWPLTACPAPLNLGLSINPCRARSDARHALCALQTLACLTRYQSCSVDNIASSILQVKKPRHREGEWGGGGAQRQGQSQGGGVGDDRGLQAGPAAPAGLDLAPWPPAGLRHTGAAVRINGSIPSGLRGSPPEDRQQGRACAVLAKNGLSPASAKVCAS